MSETVLLIEEGKKLVVKTGVTGPTSYSSPFTITINSLRRVLGVLDARITGGYHAEPVTYETGNVVGVKVYYQTGVSGEPLTEVASGFDLSAETIDVVAVGW